MVHDQNYYNLDIFEKETVKFIRSFFYERRKKRVRIITAIIIIPLIILGSSQLVKADLFYFYSPLCLGSWAHVRNVEGEPQVSRDGNINDFNNSNSAILKNSGGQIFCGKFESSNLPEGNIREITLRLSLAVQKEQPAQFIPQDLNNGNILDSEADQSGTFIIDPERGREGSQRASASYGIDTPTPEVKIKTDETKDEKSKTETILPTPEKVETPTSDVGAEPVPSPSATSTPTLSPSSTSSPQPTPSSESAPSIQPEPPTSFLNKIIGIAHAQEEPSEKPLNLDDLLSVRYTLDGETWNELGRITLSNWNDLSFKIPISSLDQISQLQISLMSLPTIDSTVTIFLDSIWLEAEADSTIIEFVGNIFETIVETVTLQNLMSNEETAQPSPELKEIKLVKIKEYNFDIGGSEKVDDELEWYSREDIRKLEKTSSQDRNIDVSTKNGSQTLFISGSCKDKFYVILLYRNREDYAKNPSSAVYNSAFECDGTINHRLETENLTGGDYWLLIGEQGNKGTWIPVSDLKKIKLEITEKEIEQQQ